MYEIKVEPAFRADYARIMKRHPRLKGEFKEAVSELMRTGAVPEEYGPHELVNPGGTTMDTSTSTYRMALWTWSFCTCLTGPIQSSGSSAWGATRSFSKARACKASVVYKKDGQ